MVSLADIQINRDHDPGSDADEDLSHLSMESAFTAPGIDMDERRMQVRAYNHWLAMVENGELPAVEELRPEEIADFGPNGVLIDLTLGVDRPAIVYLGELLAEECGDDRDIFVLGDVPELSLLSRLTEHCLEVVATHSPVGFDAEFVGRGGSTIYYRSILLPYSSNGSMVDFVFGVISWKEGTWPAAPLAPTPLPQADSLTPAVLTPLTPKLDKSLGGMLARAREAASQAFASEARSRDALYRAISGTYDLALAGAVDPAGFEELAAGTAVQDPARAATLLVFGPDLDKTRRSEIVTVLAHAWHQDLPRGGLYARLAAAPGGVKGWVAEARQLRGGKAGKSGERQLSQALARKLQRIAPLAVEVAVTGGREFALLVARRNRDGSLELIGDAGGEVRLLERAAKRLLAA